MVLRSGPSNQHRIVHAALPSGTRLETLAVDEQAGFTQIRTSRGTEGWVRTQYLKFEPIAAARLERANAQLADVRKQLADAQARIGDLTASNREQSSANQQRSSRIETLQSELEELKRVSADAITTYERAQSLEEENVRLRDELDDMAEERARLEDNNFNQTLMIGGGLIFLGLIAGVAIKARPQRSAWS